MESVATNLLNDPDVGAIVLNARDVTDRRELGEKLVHNAFHDTLTNLPNLALFAEHLEGALSRVQAEQQAVVLFVDLDDFKNINDTLGHSAGDVALVVAADRLRAVSPIGSTVARLAGDEFAVLMENLPLGFDLHRTVGDMQARLGQPYVIGGSKLLISASIGVAASGQGVYDAEELLRNADIAMYVAKKSGKARFSFYDPSMNDDIIDRLRLKADLDAGTHVTTRPGLRRPGHVPISSQQASLNLATPPPGSLTTGKESHTRFSDPTPTFGASFKGNGRLSVLRLWFGGSIRVVA